MSERLVQALIRAGVVFVVAGLTALGADASGIVEIGTGGDPFTSPLILSIVMAAIQGALKFFGGATAPAGGLSGARGLAGDGGSAKRPNTLAV